MKLRTLPLSKVKPGTRILYRADFNVPLVDGKVKTGENLRIQKTVPELSELIDKGAKVIIISHLGRPDGIVNKDYTLKPIAGYLSKLLGREVKFSEEITGQQVELLVSSMKPGEILMLENVRFQKGELTNSKIFAEKLAKLGDVYINNAFATCHRKHASVNAITKFLPSYAGALLHEEVTQLSKKLVKPFFLVLGGIKLETKINLINKLAPQAEAVLLGGGVGSAFCENYLGVVCNPYRVPISEGDKKVAGMISNKFKEKVFLPIDVVSVTTQGKVLVVDIEDLLPSSEIIDIGPKTIKLYKKILAPAKSVVWNGSMGVTENSKGEFGTLKIAKTISELTDARLVIGGGDTISFLSTTKVLDRFTFISSGGGAMLAFLGGEQMPGLAPLIEK